MRSVGWLNVVAALVLAPWLLAGSGPEATLSATRPGLAARQERDRPHGPASRSALPQVGQVQTLELVGQIGGALRAVAARGPFAYVAEGPRLVVVDASDPARPTAVGQSPVLTGQVDAVSVDGGYV